MPVQVILTSDFEQMSDVAAEWVEDRIRRVEAARGDVVLGLATGNSPTGLYRRIAQAASAGRIDCSRWRTFNLDEYVGLPRDGSSAGELHPESYRRFMEEHLFRLLPQRPMECHLPRGESVDPGRLEHELAADPAGWHLEGSVSGKAVVIHEDCASPYLQWVRNEVLEPYSRRIEEAGGIDLQILGVGGRGHVAFHEAGIPFECNGLLLVELDIVTKQHAVEDGHFASLEECPRFALTMSIDLVFSARDILVLANGDRKRMAIASALLAEPTDRMPLSYVQIHAARGGKVSFIVDESAAADLLDERVQATDHGFSLEDLRP